MGTLINVAAIIAATMIGLVLKKGLSEKIQKAVIFAIGLGLFAVSIGWFVADFIVIEQQEVSTRFDMLMIISLVLGIIIGAYFNLDDKINNFAFKVETKYHLPPVAKGFVTATLIFGVGAMSITGAIQDGVGDGMNILLVKSTLDFFTGIILTSTLGVGVGFSAIFVLVYQGSITLLASVISQYVSSDMITSVSMVGNIILIAIALNFMEIKKIKIANLIPALLIPVIYFIILSFI